MKKIYANPQEYLDMKRMAAKNWPSSQTKFVAIDGEGLGEGRNHRYVLLCSSRGKVLREDIKGRGIPTKKALHFILDSVEEYPNHVHVSYGFRYDVNMILYGSGLETPYEHLKKLQYSHRVFLRNFGIEFIPRRYFSIREYERIGRDKRDMDPERTGTVWDVIGFFQSSFVKALQGMFSDDELDKMGILEIENGKKLRGRFTYEDLESGLMESYCLKECYALENMMGRFRVNSRDSGINLRRYDGAGAGASALLHDHSIEKVCQKSMEIMPHELWTPQQVAYGGGRNEMIRYGHTDEDTHHCDIRNSYPAETAELIDLSDGEWVNFKSSDELPFLPIFEENEFALYRVYWDFRYVYDKSGKRHHRNPFEIMFPFFYRLPWGEPRIYYPPQGYSWVWSPELQVAEKYRSVLFGELRVLEGWRFRPSSDRRPFEFIKDLYKKRLWYESIGMHGQAMSIKLSLNAIPGKLAQSVGFQNTHRRPGKDSVNGIPPFFNMLYAGYINSRVRAKVYDAAMRNPRCVIGIGTDGLWSSPYPLHGLDIGDDLGQWKYEILRGFTSVQAGIYFTRKENGEEVHRYRGFNDGSIREEDVIAKWRDRGYTLRVPTRRFVTMGTALRSEEAYRDEWCTWEESDRILQIQPNQQLKRQAALGRDARPTDRAAYELVDTTASSIMRFDEGVAKWGEYDRHGRPIEYYMSKKYPLPWDKYEHKSVEQLWIEQQEEIAAEVTDSEV